MSEHKPENSKGPVNINYIIYYESIYQCTPWMNSISMFNKENRRIKVYQRKYFGGKYNEEHNSIKFDVITSYNPKVFYQLFYQTARAFNFLKRIKLGKISSFGIQLNYVYTSFMFILTIYLKTRKLKAKEVFIAGDPVSLIASYFAAKKNKHILVYWPLELWVYKDLKLIYFKFLKKIEIRLNKSAAGTLEFGTQRRALLSEENKIAVNDISVIPNAPVGEARLERNYYFNGLFGIPSDKKIILYAGGFGYFNGIPQLIDNLKNMPANYALVLHSKMEMKKKNFVELQEKLKPYNAYLSSNPLPFDKINLIYSSCDIGLMLMGPDNGNWDTNYIYADWSPGKLFNYLQFGVPLITTNLKGYKELIEDNGVGKVVDDINHVFFKADEIMQDAASYRNNCLKLFNELKFEKYHKIFYDKIFSKNYN